LLEFLSFFERMQKKLKLASVLASGRSTSFFQNPGVFHAGLAGNKVRDGVKKARGLAHGLSEFIKAYGPALTHTLLLFLTCFTSRETYT
jgi:hypothetical protein